MEFTTDHFSYTVLRSRRKTLGLEVKTDGRVLVRAPLSLPEKQIRSFVEQHESWVLRQQKKMSEREVLSEQTDPLSDDEIRILAQKAAEVIPERVAYYAPLIGVSYGRITIRCQKSRWGSCSSKGNLNFNCLLMLTPPEAIDSVVVHELCHRKEMNHSGQFYAEVLRVFPEYKKWQAWLKKNGAAILARRPEA